MTELCHVEQRDGTAAAVAACGTPRVASRGSVIPAVRTALRRSAAVVALASPLRSPLLEMVEVHLVRGSWMPMYTIMTYAQSLPPSWLFRHRAVRVRSGSEVGYPRAWVGGQRTAGSLGCSASPLCHSVLSTCLVLHSMVVGPRRRASVRSADDGPLLYLTPAPSIWFVYLVFEEPHRAGFEARENRKMHC